MVCLVYHRKVGCNTWYSRKSW